ncbi:hypothetical protein [Frondihabitans sucicola]|uniref:hypothetical protein n=1 Tax=Frondihabitans sucicola TaxID=1268041 RepID=UPI002573B2E8|nr:hypothetical protein [Frondihabitans sucicola]
MRDREAGGAWLATNQNPPRASVVLNRHEQFAEPTGGYTSRGTLPLAAVTGAPTGPEHPATRAYNLVSADASGVTFTRWDGTAVQTQALPPGVHMITHEGPDVASVPRELRWLPEFRRAERPSGSLGSGSWGDWLAILRTSSSLPTDDPEALFRSDVIDGHHYASLSVSLLALADDDVWLRHARLDEPGHLEGTLDWQ